MPYVEITAPRAATLDKQSAVRAVTAGVTQAFDVPPSTVTVYFQTVSNDEYAHAGELGHAQKRVFVKVHAFRRTLDERRAVARALTPPIARCYGVSETDVAVYFFDRERDEVSHGGEMACDGGAAS